MLEGLYVYICMLYVIYFYIFTTLMDGLHMQPLGSCPYSDAIVRVAPAGAAEASMAPEFSYIVKPPAQGTLNLHFIFHNSVSLICILTELI